MTPNMSRYRIPALFGAAVGVDAAHRSTGRGSAQRVHDAAPQPLKSPRPIKVQVLPIGLIFGLMGIFSNGMRDRGAMI